MNNLLHEELTKQIIGLAMQVHTNLKPGLDEKIYEKAMVIELTEKGIQCDQQKRFKIHYKTKLIGELIPDLIIDKKVIVDTKVVTDFNDAHIAQMLGYLNITNLKVGLLINFKKASLEWKRITSSKSI
ncbi:MAG: GxxExxY protein [Opitutales bacterium]|nr:GxxExxY protein [Opitutales bacterium]